MPPREPSTSPSNIECPSCGAVFSIATLGKRRRVQCPKCREVVTLEKEKEKKEVPTDVIEALKSEVDVLRAEVERLSAMEARVAALERELSSLRIEAQPEVIESSAQPLHLRWLSRKDAEAAHEDAALDPKREEILLHNLQQSPGKMIAIRSAAGDPNARQLAERFKAVFERSSWRVVGVDEVVLPTAQHGLALAGGALPTPPDLASAYIAFTAAGFDLVPRLDPALEPNDAVLIVA